MTEHAVTEHAVTEHAVTEHPAQPPAQSPSSRLSVAFLLASYTSDAPAGMERATAALAAGLRRLGHRAVILTGAAQPTPDPDVIELRTLATLATSFPCDDATLRRALHDAGERLHREVATLFDSLGIEVAVYVDALWGLGCVRITHRARPVLAVHVVGQHQDLAVALAEAEHVIAPSATVLGHAARSGYDTTGWSVVPNALLHEHPPPDTATRAALRAHAPIRVLSRLGPEKNIPALLRAAPPLHRPVQVVVAAAGFEPTPGAQAREWSRCADAAARHRSMRLRSGGLAWRRVPGWLADAAAVIVPSRRESFGMVALEAMSVGTPVICFDVDHLPTLVGAGPDAGGIVVPHAHGEDALWRAADHILSDPITYAHLSRAAYYRSRDFRPTTVAEMFAKAVR